MANGALRGSITATAIGIVPGSHLLRRPFRGKIVAALDRQHPRDLFDVRDLLANEARAQDEGQSPVGLEVGYSIFTPTAFEGGAS
jgi:hypothetical protein